MVELNATQMAFYNQNPGGPLAYEDVILVLGNEATDEDVMARLDGMDLLPDYLADLGRMLYLWRGSERISETEFTRIAHLLTSGPSREENDRRCIATLRRLLREAFSLCALLEDPDGVDLSDATFRRFHVETRPAETGVDGTVDYVTSWDIPACDYLQFLWEGCRSISGRPFWADAYMIPNDPNEGCDPVSGWIGNQAGARMQYISRDLTDDEAGRETCLRQLCKFLLDVHLHDCQIVTYDVGKQVIAAKHAVAAFWVGLRQGVDVGRAGTCRVCGKPFIATNERRNKARYCNPRGGCPRAYVRTRQVLGAMQEGATLDEALGGVEGISHDRVIDIVRRNRFGLGKEFPGLDLDAITEEGGDAR